MEQVLLEIFSRITEEEKNILENKELDKTIYTDHRDFKIDNKKMLARGRLIAIRPHTRFIDFPEHSHNYVEIMYVCKGKTIHLINGNYSVTVKEGELLFLNRSARHSIKAAGAEDISINFIVLPQFFDTAYDMMEKGNVLSNFVAESLNDKTGGLDYLHFKVSDVLPVQNLVENLIWNIAYQIPNRKSINKTTMGLLFLTLLNYTDHLKFKDSDEYEHSIVFAVLKEIEENYRHVSLSDFSNELNQPLVKISKLIKESTGKTFKEILQDKRFGKAAQLLQNTSLSVSDIAHSVGYENISYFHRQFQKKYGVTPSNYRVKVLNE